MTVDASAQARVLGISMEYQDMRAGGVLFLPQHIYLIAQGNTDSVYSSTKFVAGSAAEVGAIAGYGSPAHNAMRQLRPVNGDGVGTIPVTVALVQQDASGVAAVGALVPSGTQVTAAEYRVLVGNILSLPFVLAVGDSLNETCRKIRTAILGVLEMPVTPTILYGTVTAGAITGGTGNGTVTALSVPTDEQPNPGAWVFKCVTAVANGGVFTLTDPTGVVYDVTLTVGVGATTVVAEGGIQFTVTDGTTDFGVGAQFTITVPATSVSLPVKWKGASGNAVRVAIDGDDLGVTIAITQPVNGLANPSVQGALDQMGNVWYSMVINALNISDTTALDAIQTAGEGRWGALVHKPFVCFTGVTSASVSAATAVSSVRQTDRINAQLVNPGSDDLPFVVAARQVARIAKVANDKPPFDYGSQRATGLVSGADTAHWDYVLRDQALKAGSSTIEVKDGVVNISDVVTFYHPTGEEPPAYRYVCDIVKLQNFIYNISLIFAQTEWDGAPLVPDDQPVALAGVKKPRMAKAAVNAKLDSLGLNAIISDPKAAKKLTQASINASNPKRLDVTAVAPISGNTNIVNVELKFGFYFPAQTAAA